MLRRYKFSARNKPSIMTEIDSMRQIDSRILFPDRSCFPRPSLAFESVESDPDESEAVESEFTLIGDSTLSSRSPRRIGSTRVDLIS